MTTHKEALTLALEAAEIGLANLTSYQSSGNSPTIHEYGQAARALAKVRAAKEALAQPEQEPVACGICGKYMHNGNGPIKDLDCGGDCCECMALAGDPDCIKSLSHIPMELVRIAEDPPEVQCSKCEMKALRSCGDLCPVAKHPPSHKWVYTTPPYVPTERQRKPLTHQDLAHLWMHTNDYYKFARAIEAAHGIKE